MPFFDTPGSLRDAPAGSRFYDDWSEYLAGRLAARTPGSGGGSFFDPSEQAVPIPTPAERHLVWMGFPRTVLTLDNRDDRAAAFAAGDDRDASGSGTVQDEYLEWRATRNAAGKLTKVVFVTETPEYWEQLAAAHFDVVLGLYRTLVDPAVTPAGLRGPGGAYDRENVWNTSRGIMHYVERFPDNTLDAALGLAQGSVTSSPPGARDNYETSANAPTSADPRVGLDVAVLARKGLAVTLGQPVGIYMVDWDDTGFSKPDGLPVGDYWTVVRGARGAALRLVYEVPAGEGFVVGDIRIGGRRIEHAGQIAEHVTVMIAGVAGRG